MTRRMPKGPAAAKEALKVEPLNGSDPDLGPLSVEVWRLGKRLGALPVPEERLADSHRRLTAELTKLHVRIDDPLGQQYIDGMHADVVDQPTGCDPTAERIIISDVLRPSVFVNGICVVMPQIVLERDQGNRHEN
jgi:hypothetical protein